MSTIKWRGDAPKSQQTSTVQLTAYDATTTYSITMNGKTLSQIGTGGTVATTATAFLAVLQASTIAEFQEVIWSLSASDTIKGTAKIAGVPFTFTKSVSGGTGTMGSITTTAGSGPNDASVAINWTGGVLPTTGDTIIFENNAVNCCYGLAAFNGVVLAAIIQKMSYTGQRGLPEVNSSGYQEYRPTYFQSAAAAITIGDGTGQGSGLTKDDCGSAQTALIVRGTGSAAVNGSAAYCFKGTNSSNTATIVKGSVDIAYFAGETANLNGGFNVGYATNVQADATVRCGSGVALATITKTGGTLELNSNYTTMKQQDGVTTMLAGTSGTLTLNGGSFIQKGNGTMTTVTHAGGTLDFNQGQGGITVTTYKGYSGITLNDTSRRVTWTNGVNLEDCKIADVKIDLGTSINLVVAAAA